MIATARQGLKAQIKTAFGSVPFPSHQGLRGSMARDDYATDEEAQSITTGQDILGEWWQISKDELRSCALGLSYVDAAGVLFYLPAYLDMALDDVSKKRLWVLQLLDTGIGGDDEPRLRAYNEGQLHRLNHALRWRVLNKPVGRRNSASDALLELRYAGKTLKYAVEVKRRLRPATLGAVIHQVAAHGDHALLVSDHVTPPLADQLRAQGVQFIDAAGNAFLNAPPLLIWVKGEKPAERLTPHRDRGRASQRPVFRLCLPCSAIRMRRIFRTERLLGWPAWHMERWAGSCPNCSNSDSLHRLVSNADS